MDHIEIYVSDLKNSRLFYSWLLETLGFKIFQDWHEGFSYKKQDFYIVFVQTVEKYIEYGYHRQRIGLNHLAFKCDSKETFEKIHQVIIERDYNMLYSEKYPFAGGPNHYALYFEDPDRIKIEIVLHE